MKIRMVVLFVVIFQVSNTIVLNASESAIVGEWVSAKTTRGGLGTTKTYTGDGKVNAVFGALILNKYKFDGNVLSILDDEGSVIQEPKVTFVGSTMILKDERSGGEQKLTRIKGVAGSGLVGKWEGEHNTGKKQVREFTKNMNSYFSVPMVSVEGKYQVNGDTLIERIPGKGKTEWKWMIQDDMLTLEKIGGNKTEKYKRKK